MPEVILVIKDSLGAEQSDFSFELNAEFRLASCYAMRTVAMPWYWQVRLPGMVDHTYDLVFSGWVSRRGQ